MADMTTKHHKLIQDCIVKGLSEAVLHFDSDRQVRYAASSTAREISKAFGVILRYTHDKFDNHEFVSQTDKMINSVMRQICAKKPSK